jgi:fatty-acyl-CoA synthase
VAYVQAKPGTTIDVDELLDFVRQRTPERAAVPVTLYVIDAIPLTGVGKVFKPALRFDAARRLVAGLLTELTPPGATISVSVDGHAVHGSLIGVSISGVPEAARDGLQQRVHERLNPLQLRHEIAWS